MKTLTASLAAVLLAACGSVPQKTAETTSSESAKPTISAEAQQALDRAETYAKEAKAKFALWTSTQNALKSAQDAAQVGDSAKVIAEASYASSQAKGGLAQLQYPSTEQK